MRLPRRADDERPGRSMPAPAEVADVRQIDIEPRHFRTRFGGLFLAFLAEDADRRVFCYANGELRKDQQNDEILRFVEFWKQRTGHLPKELVFDSRLTTYPNLSRLNWMGIDFITLRRRSSKLLRQIHQLPPSAWRQIELENVARAYRTPGSLTTKSNCRLMKDLDQALQVSISVHPGEPRFH